MRLSLMDIPKSGKRIGLAPVMFRPGTYSLKLRIFSGPNDDILDVVEGFKFIVERAPGADGSMLHQPRNWTCNGTRMLACGDQLLEMDDAAEF